MTNETNTTNKATVHKTTLGDHNGGYCNNANNCRYTGQSTCWAVTATDATGYTCDVAAFNRKWAAQGLADWMNAGQWDGRGEPVMCWISSANLGGGHDAVLALHAEPWGAALLRYIDDDSAKEV